VALRATHHSPLHHSPLHHSPLTTPYAPHPALAAAAVAAGLAGAARGAAVFSLFARWRAGGGADAGVGAALPLRFLGRGVAPAAAGPGAVVAVRRAPGVRGAGVAPSGGAG